MSVAMFEEGYYLVHERPVKVVVAADRAEILAFDGETGELVPEPKYWPNIRRLYAYNWVETLTRDQFDDIVRRKRHALAVMRSAQIPRSARTLEKPEDRAFYAVNDRPVKVVELADGSEDVRVFEWATGNFVSDESYWDHVYRVNPFKDVDTLTRSQFYEIVRRLRMKVIVKRVTTPMVWDPTNDEGFPYKATVDGHTFTIRVNDVAADLMYTLLADGEELADLGGWPDMWQRRSVSSSRFPHRLA